MVAYGVLVCGVDCNVEVDGLCVVIYRLVFHGVDFNVEVDGLFVVAFGVVVCGEDFYLEVNGLCMVAYGEVVLVWILMWWWMVCVSYHMGRWSLRLTLMWR